ncbi:MAG: PD40 domain-containing protein [Fidelibacterota bacterium]|nr:MAG: PD40 domain-containing protein [Candidatus Neomarinimicrobiota bacterium]
MKPDGSDVYVLLHHDRSNDYYKQAYQNCRWSPNKGMLVVEGGPGSTNDLKPLWLMDPSKGRVRELTWNGRSPFWTPDGQHIIYSHNRWFLSPIWDFYKINISSLEIDTVLWVETGPPGSNSWYGYQLYGIFPQDGTKLLMLEWFTYQDTTGIQVDDDDEIIIYDYDLKHKTYLTNNTLNEGWCSVSSDGAFIAYTRQNPQIYPYTNNVILMTADGDSVRQLTSGLSDVYRHPVWSPDGQYLALYKKDQSEGYNPYGEIVVLELQTGTMDTLTHTAHLDSIGYVIAEWR